MRIYNILRSVSDLLSYLVDHELSKLQRLMIYRSIRLVLSLFLLTTNRVKGMLPFCAPARVEHAHQLWRLRASNYFLVE
jgi:hypothetical protein